MSNPIVLICTHNRLDITTRNINTLLLQSVLPKIVLVASEKHEIEYYKETFPQITIAQHPNHPLGDKWQMGVNVARKLGADPLIISGSDDILGPTYVEDAINLLGKGYNFIGVNQYWVHQGPHAFLVDYLADQTLGGGRVYSKFMLETIRYKLFATTQERRLDDQGDKLVKMSGLDYFVVRDVAWLSIHSIKGTWPMMNPFDKNHKNVRVVRSEPSENILKW